MADDIKVQAGTGDSTVAPPVATDDIGGRHFQRIKVGWGAEGVFQETTDTDGLRVPIGGGQIGLLTEAAPASDTASSGLNGRLQRIAQRITSLIAQLPATLGQKTMAASLAVTLASDQPARAVTGTFWQATQPVSGTFWQTTQPVSGTFWQATQPVSGTVTANAGTNTSTAALAAATATDAGDESGTDEAIAAAAAGTRLVGFSARETTGAAGAVFNIRHGTSNAGALLVTVSLGPNESTREWYGPDGIAAASGVWLERVSGQTSFVGYAKVAS